MPGGRGVLGWTRRSGGEEEGLPTLAVITMVRDEGPMLEAWLRYYAGQVGADSLVVVDDNSEDGSTDGLPCPVIRVPPLGKTFESARMGLLSGLAAGLLHAYDAVLFTDADEFVVADPARHASLRHFLAARPGADVLGVLGLNVVHDTTREEPLDLARPLLEQRALAKFLPLMCKPALKRVDAGWGHASHGIFTPYAPDPELVMFHLKFADRDTLAAVAAHRQRMVATDGRAEGTSWRFGADELVRVLDGIQAHTGGDIPEFVAPPPRRLAKIVVRQPNGLYKATGKGQLPAMQDLPLVRIPDRFRSAL